MKIAILGTGLMGSGFAEGFMSAGHEVIVYNRSKARTQPLVSLGAKAVNTPAEAFEEADASILVLLDGKAVGDILFSPQAKEVLNGKKILNASTTRIEEIMEISKEAKALGCDLAEASILTGPDELRAKQSAFFLGCSETTKSFWEEILGSVSSTVYHVGEIGNASKAETPIVFSSAIGLVNAAYTASVIRKLNLPEEISAMYAQGLGTMGEYLLPQMVSADYDSIMATVNNNLTVAKTAASNAKSFGFPNQLFVSITKLFEEAAKRGLGEKDGSAVCEVILNPPE